MDVPYSQVIKGAVDQVARSLNDLGTVVAEAIGVGSTASRSIDTTLGLIRGTLAGVLQANVMYADRESNVYKGFVGSITGTTPLTVWTPDSGMRYKLKGYAIAAVVSPDVIASSEGVLLYLQDSGITNTTVAPIAALSEDLAAETMIGSGLPIVVNLGSGRLGTYSTSVLRITTDTTIGGGAIKLVGAVWGTHIPNGSLGG